MILIIDNFLPKSLEENLYKTVTDDRFKWNYRTHTVGSKCSYANNPNYKDTNYLVSDFLENVFLQHIVAFFEHYTNIEPKRVIRSKVNFHFINSEIKEHPPHVDATMNGSYSILYYVNNSNGYTKFIDDNRVVEHKRNRALIFNSNLLHCGSNSTDIPRIAINTIIATNDR